MERRWKIRLRKIQNEMLNKIKENENI